MTNLALIFITLWFLMEGVPLFVAVTANYERFHRFVALIAGILLLLGLLGVRIG